MESAAFGNRSARVSVTSSKRASTSAFVVRVKIDRKAAAQKTRNFAGPTQVPSIAKALFA
jgi:hypothetical protein